VGIRSDVAVAVKASFFDTFKEWCKENMTEDNIFDIEPTSKQDEAILYVFEDIKWNVDNDQELQKFINFVQENSENFYVYEVCPEYSSTESWGKYTDNPFDIGHSFSLQHSL
jgi:hypothetical protein